MCLVAKLKTGTKGLVFPLVFRRQVFTEMYSPEEYLFFQKSSQLKKALFLWFSSTEM